jgi:hypothetical protein
MKTVMWKVDRAGERLFSSEKAACRWIARNLPPGHIGAVSRVEVVRKVKMKALSISPLLRPSR